jgi:hypothetical protein
MYPDDTSQADWDELAKRDTALTHVDQQIEFFEKNLAILRERLGPVLSRYDTEKSAVEAPRPEPSSELRARAERLRECNARFEALINQLDI